MEGYWPIRWAREKGVMRVQEPRTDEWHVVAAQKGWVRECMAAKDAEMGSRLSNRSDHGDTRALAEELLRPREGAQ